MLARQQFLSLSPKHLPVLCFNVLMDTMFLSVCPESYLVEVALAAAVLAEVPAGLALEILQV